MWSPSAIVRKAVEPVATRVLLAWERLESGVSYHPGSATILSDPYGVYQELRRKDPVHRMRLIDAWALTRYRDVDAVLRDHARFSNEVLTGVVERTGVVSMLDRDPPDHTRLRSLVSQAFTPRAIERLRPRIESIAERLLNDIAGRDRVNLIASYAYPLPIIVIAEMLGVPPADMDRFEVWSNDISLNIEPFLDEDGVERVKRARHELGEYFEWILDQRRREPREDVVSDMLIAEEQGDKLSHEDLITTLILLLAAGNETTRNLIGNGMLALLAHPDQMQRLRADPTMIGSAVKEFLRFDPPVQTNGRAALEDLEIDGKRIRAGQLVIGVIGAANRDPEVFADPETLDITRTGPSHLSFGRGIHYCLGAALAEMEARIAFTALLRRFGSIRLASEPVRRERMVLRGLSELWVDVETSANGNL